MLRALPPINNTCPTNLKYAACEENKWVCSPSGYNTLEQACQNPTSVNCGVNNPGICPGMVVTEVVDENGVVVEEEVVDEDTGEVVVRPVVKPVVKPKKEKKFGFSGMSWITLIFSIISLLAYFVLWIYMLYHAVTRSQTTGGKIGNFLLAFTLLPIYILSVFLRN